MQCKPHNSATTHNRLAKLFRLVRLMKVAKLLKWMINREKNQTGDKNNSEDSMEIKTSVVGKKMTEQITKKGKKNRFNS